MSRLKEREELIRVQYERLKESDNMKNEFINVAAMNYEHLFNQYSA